jgi:hypothetical protein
LVGNIQQVTGLNEKLIQEYCDLFEEYRDSERVTELNNPL